MKKVNMVLGGVLALQVVLILAVASPFRRGESATVTRLRVLEGVEPSGVVKLRITDDKGESVELGKKEGKWTLASAGGYPVKEDKVEPLLEKLVDLKGGRPVTRKAKNYTKLEVAEDKFQRKVELFGDDEREVATLYVGSSPNYNLRNVRRKGEDAVYLAAGVSPWELATGRSQWIDTKWFEIKPDEVTSLAIRHAGTEVRVERQEDGGWQMLSPKPSPAPKDKVDSVLRGFEHVYLSDVVGENKGGEYGLEDPTVEVEIVVKRAKVKEKKDKEGEAEAPAETETETETEPETETETETETYRIVVGKKREGKPEYFATRNGSDFVATLSSYTVENKFEKKPEDFLPTVKKKEEQAPAEGTEAPEGGAKKKGAAAPVESSPKEGGGR